MAATAPAPFKGTPTAFCSSFKWTRKLQWFDRQGLGQMSGDRVVKVTLSTNGTSGRYEGFQVAVVSKSSGTIAEKYFAFGDYIRERSDDRHESPDQKFCVIDHCGWSWYIAVPKSTVHFVSRVEAWIAEWEVQS